MKNVILALSVFCCTLINAYSQIVPNAGFENWLAYPPPPATMVYEEPVGWTSNNPDPSVPPTVTKSTSACSGTYSARIENLTYTNQITSLLDTAQGYMVSGPDLAAYQIGFPCSVRVLSVDFCIKYTRMGNDSAELNLSFKKWNTQSNQSDQVSTQGSYKRIGTTSASFYSVNVPVTYINGIVIPDTAIITISSSSLGSNPSITPGSMLWVDDIVFNYSTVGIDEKISDNSRVNVYPNPAKGEINFSYLPSGSGIVRLMDIAGRVVSQVSVNGANQTMNLKNVNAGIYVYEVVSTSGKVLATGKVSVTE